MTIKERIKCAICHKEICSISKKGFKSLKSIRNFIFICIRCFKKQTTPKIIKEPHYKVKRDSLIKILDKWNIKLLNSNKAIFMIYDLFREDYLKIKKQTQRGKI